jgi:6-pyruvoyltetrahydropterin/6-carboxytetrahydropterin synthase
MYELSIQDHIASAHLLRGYDGPCRELHGHTWQVEVTVLATDLNPIGLVADFKDMKAKLKKFLAHLDHVNLNDLPAFQKDNPSTENLARYIYRNFSKECSPLKIKHVRVWESATAYITYYE